MEIGVLISGGGTNLQAIIDGVNSGVIDGNVKLIISDNEDAYGLTRGKKAGIESIYINPEGHDIVSYSKLLINEFQSRNIDLIVLAGFLKILSKEFIEIYRNKIINIHPSLIPSFSGKGFYGEKVHEAVLDYGVKFTGATVHFVDEDADTGPIILQDVVEVSHYDTIDSLKAKVLKVEHRLLVEALKLYCENKLEIDNRQVIISRSDEMRRALISCYDKEGIVEFAHKLTKLGWELISTGGTYKVLKESGLEVMEIEDITKFPEILGGRVKTLNPYIHGGILYKRDDDSHLKTIREMNIGPIDMVVNNLYPFEETIQNKDATDEEIIENIDIGGPSMIRAAAKNHKDVTVIIDPNDYKKVLEELESEGHTSIELRQYLARKVFNYTGYYDSLISNYFNELEKVKFPDYKIFGYKLSKELRYGENPHQKAAFYKSLNDDKSSIENGVKLHGKELSFNNINDGNAAIEIIKEFQDPTAVALKHTNPCGIGSGENLLEAYKKAYNCDDESIYGGIVAVNRQVDNHVALEISKIFLEILIAPSFTDEAIEILTRKKNMRIIQLEDMDYIDENHMNIKDVLGGILLQEKNKSLLSEEMKVVTDREPTEDEMKDLFFAWKAAKNIKSNGIVLAKDRGTIGLGVGEVNRYWAVENAIKRANGKVEGSVIASDGFFPFKDSIELLGKVGVSAIIHPGGSIRDEEVIQEANKYNIAMIFTGIRHFNH